MLEDSCPVCNTKFQINRSNEPRWKDSTFCTAELADGSCCNTLITLEGTPGQIRDVQHYDGKNVVAKLKDVLKPADDKSDVFNHIKAVVEEDIALGRRTEKSNSMMRVEYKDKSKYVFFDKNGKIDHYGDIEMVLNRLSLRTFKDEGEDPEKWLGWDDFKQEFTGSSTQKDAALKREYLIKEKPKLIKLLTEEKSLIENEIDSFDVVRIETKIKHHLEKMKELSESKTKLNDVKTLIEKYKNNMLFKFIKDVDTRSKLNNQHYWFKNYKKINSLQSDDIVFEELRQASEIDPELDGLIDVLEGTIGLIGKFVDEETGYDEIIVKFKTEDLSPYIRMDSSIETRINNVLKKITLEKDPSNLNDEIRSGDALYKILSDKCDSLLKVSESPFEFKIDKLLSEVSEKIEKSQIKVDKYMKAIPEKTQEFTLKRERIEEINKYLANPNLIPELKEYIEWLWENDLVYINDRLKDIEDETSKIISGRKNFIEKRLNQYSSLSRDNIDSFSGTLLELKSMSTFFDSVTDYFTKRLAGMPIDSEAPPIVSAFYDKHAKPGVDVSVLNEKYSTELMSKLKSLGFRKGDDFPTFIKNKDAELLNLKVEYFVGKVLEEHLRSAKEKRSGGYSDEGLESMLKNRLGEDYDSAYDFFKSELSEINKGIKADEMSILTAESAALKEAEDKIIAKSKTGLDESDYILYPSNPKKAEEQGWLLVDSDKEPKIYLIFTKHQDDDGVSINKAVNNLMTLAARKVNKNANPFFKKLKRDDKGLVEGERYELSIEVFGKPCYVDFVRKRVEGETFNFAKDVLSLHELLKVYEGTEGKHSFKGFCETYSDALEDIQIFSKKSFKKSVEYQIKKIRTKLDETPDYVTAMRNLAVNYEKHVKKMGTLKGVAYAAVSTLLGYEALTFVLKAMEANSAITASTASINGIYNKYPAINSISGLEARIAVLDPQEDLNNNGIEDPGEDLDNDGVFEDYEVSAANGDVAEASDAVKLYNAVFGTDVDFDRMCNDRTYAFNINNVTINEVALGYDVDGDSVLETSIPNPFYLNIGDPGSDNWSDDQQAGIEEHQDYTAAGGVRSDVTEIGRLEGLIQDASEFLGLSVPLTITFSVAFSAAVIYGIYKYIKHSSAKRKDPVGKPTVADFYDLYKTVDIADEHFKIQKDLIHKVSKSAVGEVKNIKLEFSLGDYKAATIA